jgi:predicted ATP-binding protein involved in virulence
VSTDYSEFRVSRNPRDFLMKKNGVQFSINELSDGEKCYLTLIGDIARMLAMTNRGDENPLEGKGCILIDEVDLHLHPLWQSEILGRLTQIFPGCQFVITTHSPFLVSNVRPFAEDKFFLMEQSNAREVGSNTYGKRIDQILLEFFHVNSLRNSEVEQIVSKIWNHLSAGDQDSDQYRELKEWLRSHIDSGDEVIARINLEEIKQRKNGK